MSTSVGGRVVYLDGIRGLAIASVIIGHFVPGMRPLALFGVQLFFALSGYLIADVLFRRQTRVRTFVWRRVTRIIPGLWVYLVFALAWAAFVQPTPYVPTGPEMVATLLFLGSYFPADLSIWANNWANGHLWSLNVEEHSYLVLAAVALIARDRRSQLVVLLITGICAAMLAVNLAYMYSYVPPGASPAFVRTESAGLGMMAAALYRLGLHDRVVAWVGHDRHLVFTALVVGLVVAAALMITKTSGIGRTIAAPVLLALAVAHVADAGRFLHRVLESRVLVALGLASFSLYLYQQPFFISSEWLSPVLGLPIALLLGFASYRLIEGPARNYLNGLLR